MATSDRRPFRHYLKEWRNKRGLSQAELAKAIGTHKGMISRYELGQRGLTLEIQFALMAALGITPAQFFAHPDEESADVALSATSAERREMALRLIKELIKP